MGNIYDGAFRTILNDCRKFILPVINEIFGEEYTGSEKIEFFPNEHFLDQQDEADKERITDTNFRILGKTVKKIVTPGGTVEYNVPIMKVQMYSLEDIFEKGLLLLIPFYIFSHEKDFSEYNSNEQKLEELKAEYRDILERLDGLERQGDIGAFDKRTIIELSGDVIREIAQKYENVQKGVGDIMGGALIETSARRLKTEAEIETKKKTALRMLQDGELPIDKIAKYSGLDIEDVEQLAGVYMV